MTLGRPRDFISHHVRLTQRVRDLETGVHPVSARYSFGSSVEPTVIVQEPGTGTWVAVSASTAGLRWRKRMGIASLMGGYQLVAGGAGTFPAAGVIVGHVPNGSRPSVDMSYRAAAIQAPYSARVDVRADGAIVAYRDASMGAGDVTVRVDSVQWPVA